MTALARYKRSIWVAAISVAVFGWTAVVALPQDNSRFSASLHHAHQGDKFRSSLAELNAGRLSEDQLNECTACHDDRGWMETMITERPVANQGCLNCHRPDTDRQMASIGRPMGRRVVRLGHQTLEGDEKTDLGLRTDPDTGITQPLLCYHCHNDHQGPDFVETTQRYWLSVFEKEHKDHKALVGKISVHDSCLGCHLPSRDVSNARDVWARFFRDHEGAFNDEESEEVADYFDWVVARALKLPQVEGLENPDALAKLKNSDEKLAADLAALVKQVADQPFEQNARKLVTEAMMLDSNPKERRCAGCHSEHTPNAADRYANTRTLKEARYKAP